jgi:hypothetical protein
LPRGRNSRRRPPTTARPLASALPGYRVLLLSARCFGQLAEPTNGCVAHRHFGPARPGWHAGAARLDRGCNRSCNSFAMRIAPTVPPPASGNRSTTLAPSFFAVRLTFLPQGLLRYSSISK